MYRIQPARHYQDDIGSVVVGVHVSVVVVEGVHLSIMLNQIIYKLLKTYVDVIEIIVIVVDVVVDVDHQGNLNQCLIKPTAIR